MDHIPVVDLSKISGEGPASDESLISVADELFQALSGIGFAYLSNHGISKEIIEKAFEKGKLFYELPEEVKDKSLKDISKSYNGYAKPGQELLASGSTYEVRESYDFCGNLRFYPEACKDFGPSQEALEEASKPLIKNLLRVLAIALKLDDTEYFVTRSKSLDDLSIPSYTTFRSLYYPAIPENIPPGTVRCAEHTDYGILTLLFQDDIGGLEVKSVSGKWVSAKPIPGTILPHQVLIPDAEIKKKVHRQSIAFFVHPDDDTSVSPLTGNSAEYEAVTAKDHAKRKLVSSYIY